MAIDKTKFVRGNNLAVSDFNFDDPSNTITVKTDALSSVGQAIAAAGGGSVPDASATVTGLVNNTLLQELGGKDKTINGVRVGRGPGSYTSNTVLGTLALDANTSGQANTAVGRSALKLNTTGEGNIAIGAYALEANTTGYGNTAVGGSSLIESTTGYSNTALGSAALADNIDGGDNTAIGAQAMSALTTGFGNVAVGSGALSQLTSGIGNFAIGFYAGNSQTTGDGQGHLGNGFTTDIFAQVGITTLSDERFKNISSRTIPLGLDFISYVGKNALLTFEFKTPAEGGASIGRVRYGVSAQKILEEEGDNPVLINNTDPDNLRYNEMDMVAVLIKAVSELKDEFDAYVATHP